MTTLLSSTTKIFSFKKAQPRMPYIAMGPYSFDVHAGEKIALLGPSGAGKSSLLKFLAGDFSCERGQALFLSKDLNDWSLQGLSRKRAVLPQSYEVAFSLDVELVIRLGRISKRRDPDLVSIVKKAAQLAHADHLLDRQFDSLSGGEKARVQLARVFAQVWDVEEGLLLVDEPLAALDPGLQMELLEALTSFSHERNHALLAVLHDLNQAFHYFERLWCIKNAQITDDMMCDLANLPRLEALYDIKIDVAHFADGGFLLGSKRRLSNE